MIWFVTLYNENELETKWLELEITESTMIEREENVLAKIKQYYVRWGYKSLWMILVQAMPQLRNLKDIKPDTLKIDQLFIKELPSDQDSAEIVTSIIQLAKRLGMNVVAEGVETVEQHAFLSDLQCDRIQGYLFSRPVSEENFEKLLEGQWSSEINISNTKNRRKYFRIDFKYPLEAFMTVTEINGRKVQLGNTKVLIEDIGPGGLRFLSNIKLPTRSDVILKFQIKILNEELTLYGIIVHDVERDNLYQYGIQFTVDEKQREHLIKHFNRLQLQVKKDPLLPDHPFVTESVQQYFN